MEVIYQVLPRLWGNGKFSDWNSSAFEYVKTLGATAIWYTGVIRHSTGMPYTKGDLGSPYAISNYFDVNPYLADNEGRRMAEFASLVKRTHKAGLKVLIDYVPNHVAPECKDVATFDFCDYDWTDTRKINYGAPGTWDKMREIALFWAGKGVDGLRCDMVEMVPPAFLKWLISEVKAQYPDFLFVAEVYEKGNYHRYVKDLGFDLLYDKSGVYDILRSIICNGVSATNLSYNWQQLGDIQRNMLNFMENHDEQRFASPYFAGKASKAYAAVAFEALFNGASFMLYAGQELGETASEGAEGRTSIFSRARVKSLQHIYNMINCSQLTANNKGTSSKNLGSNSSQLTANTEGASSKILCSEGWQSVATLSKSEQSILEKYREILSYTKLKVFQEGANYDLCWCNYEAPGFDRDCHFAFLRYNESESYLVFCNLGPGKGKVTLYFPDELKERYGNSITVSTKPYDATIKKISL